MALSIYGVLSLTASRIVGPLIARSIARIGGLVAAA